MSIFFKLPPIQYTEMGLLCLQCSGRKDPWLGTRLLGAALTKVDDEGDMQMTKTGRQSGRTPARQRIRRGIDLLNDKDTG